MISTNSKSFLFPTLVVTEIIATETEVTMTLEAESTSANCPDCEVPSTRHHSSYLRHIQDTPLGLMKVTLYLKVRRMRCANSQCLRKTFAEQFPELVGRRRRKTLRLFTQLVQIGLAQGGQAGARLANKLLMPASSSTVLRLIHQLEVPAVEPPRIIGLDDWAMRKGRRYGTIIVDHETGRPVDLLPSRDCADVQEWLKQYPTIELVTRDRSGEYREAITQAHPDAVQVADRWHLLKNCGEALQRYLSRKSKSIRQFVNKMTGVEEEVEVSPSAGKRRYDPGPARQALHEARTQEREALFAAVKARHAQGVYTTDLAKEFNLSRKTISHWVNCDTLPPDARGRRPRTTLIDAYVPYLHERIEAGCTNQSQLWREIGRQGFTGAREMVGKWMRQNYVSEKKSAPTWKPKKEMVVLPSASELAWLLIRHTDELEEEDRQLVACLLQDEKLAEFRRQVHQFGQMIREGLTEQWASWLQTCCSSTINELKNFALGLKKDEAAVYEAIRQPWSNGPTEGHVNRLKLLKRQMYGRASFKLLRLRVLLEH